jgi:hypothetical protein
MFGWTRLATFAAVAAVLAMATGVAGATSKPGSVSAAGSHLTGAGKITSSAATRAALLKTANLRTRAGAARYLRSIGLKASHLVIQRGIRNYAGANCPGKGWSCTSTTHPVVQIAAAGGSNTFQCSTASCTIVQVAAAGSKPPPQPPNYAACIKTTGLAQSCSISQLNANVDNKAIVVETSSKMSGLTQTASFTAQITQQQATGSSHMNTACVNQNVNVVGSTTSKTGTPVTVTLNAQQKIKITQDAGAGSNSVGNPVLNAGVWDCDSSSALTQTQTLSSTATGTGRITQNENATDNGPNLSLEIAQNQGSGYGVGSGPNTARFTQTNTLTAVANTPAGPVTQTQGSLNGGLSAIVNQFSSAKSTAVANQSETQCEHAAGSGAVSCTTGTPPSYSLTQEQHGPIRKDSPSVQSGNPDNSFTINQSSIQNNDAGSGSNQTNEMEAACSTSGNCTATQTTNINGTPSSNTQTGPSLDTTTTCSGSACTSTGTGFVISPTGFSVSNTDLAEFGFGGMRGNGTGSITASGITGPVTHAFLFWHGPTNSTDPAANASVTFNGTPITGTNIGFASDNNWGFQNSQSYRADVTSLVSGDGTYSLSNFLKAPNVDINGVSLIVFYNDSDPSNDRNVVAWNGNDSNVTPLTYATDGWDETLTNVPYPGSGTATLDLIVSDGQYVFTDDALVVNGTTIEPAGNIFDGTSTPANPGYTTNGSLWDVKSFDITSVLPPGAPSTNSLQLTTGVSQDYLSLVVAIANMPASAPPILLAPTNGLQQSSGVPVAPSGSSPRGARVGGGLAKK